MKLTISLNTSGTVREAEERAAEAGAALTQATDDLI